MRGKVSVFSLPPTTFGITPAYAGKRDQLLLPKAAWGDHPRVCGEKLANSGASIYNAGSPPRMRGKVITYQLTPERSGITPAYAGKSLDRLSAPEFTWDHPRVCGEKQNSFQFSHTILGSPPRMRGKVASFAPRCTSLRITPAYAGKRGPLGIIAGHLRDHPRVCGEKSRRSTTSKRSKGSPPRMRGKASPYVAIWFSSGITPAYAGKSPAL